MIDELALYHEYASDSCGAINFQEWLCGKVFSLRAELAAAKEVIVDQEQALVTMTAERDASKLALAACREYNKQQYADYEQLTRERDMFVVMLTEAKAEHDRDITHLALAEAVCKAADELAKLCSEAAEDGDLGDWVDGNAYIDVLNLVKVWRDAKETK